MNFNNPLQTDMLNQGSAFDPVKGFTNNVPKPKVSAGLVDMSVQLGTMAGNMANFGAKTVGDAHRQGYRFDGMAAGAQIGTTLGGPIGTAIGGVLGAGLDAYKYIQGDKQFKSQIYSDGFNAWRNMQKSDVAKKDVTGLYRSGGKVPIEVEAKEIGILKQPDASYKEVFRTGDNVKPHEEGGKKMSVPEGTEIFNNQLFDAVVQAMEAQDWETIETKLIPQRDEILEAAQEKGDPNSTGLTSEQAEGETAQQQAQETPEMEEQEHMRKGGKVVDSKMKLMKFAKLNARQFKIDSKQTSASEKPQVAMNKDMFKTGSFKKNNERIFARSGGHMRKPMAFGGSKFHKPSKHASGGVVPKMGGGGSVYGSKEGDALYGMFDKGVPNGDGYRFFGGQPNGIENAMAANPSSPIVKPLGQRQSGVETASDNRPEITGLPKQSYGQALRTVAGSIKVPQMKEPGIYDKAAIYDTAAALYNAAQPNPSYQRMGRASFERMKFDGTALDQAQQNNQAQAGQVIRGFGNSVRGVGGLMGVAANVSKSAMDSSNQIASQKSQAINQVQGQNVQIQNQENQINTQIGNQESLTNYQMRAQNAQLRAQNVKANTDAAMQTQFQEKQLEMQQEKMNKQADVQQKALSYMVNTDKWFQALSSPEAVLHQQARVTEEEGKVKSLLGENADSFMMLRSDNPELKPLLDARDKAAKEFDEKGFTDVKNKYENVYSDYSKKDEELSKFERGETEYGGMKKDASESERKALALTARTDLGSVFVTRMKELGMTESEIESLKDGEKFKRDDNMENVLKARYRNATVGQSVYQKELDRRSQEIRGKSSQYKKEYAKKIGLNEPSPDELLNVK